MFTNISIKNTNRGNKLKKLNENSDIFKSKLPYMGRKNNYTKLTNAKMILE
jgi:hypothetical protein